MEKIEASHPPKSSSSALGRSGTTFPGETEWDAFGNHLHAISDVLPAQAQLSNPLLDGPPPNRVPFEKDIERLPATVTVADVPPELLRRPLCKKFMQDAVLTKCCFKSFKVVKCEICAVVTKRTLTEGEIIQVSENKEEKITIGVCVVDVSTSRFMLGQFDDDSEPNSLCALLSELRHVEIIKPAKLLSAESEKVQLRHTRNSLVNDLVSQLEFWNVNRTVDEVGDIYRRLRNQVSSGSTSEEISRSVNSGTVEDDTRCWADVLTELVAAGDNGILWRPSQEIPADNYMMHFPPSYDPYWDHIQPGMDGFMNPFGCSMPMPYMGDVAGSFDVPMSRVLPQDPFGGQRYMMLAIPPQSVGTDDHYFGIDVNGSVSSMRTGNGISETGSPDCFHDRAERESSPDRFVYRGVERESCMDKYLHHHREKREDGLEVSHHHHRDKGEDGLERHSHRALCHCEQEISPERSCHPRHHKHTEPNARRSEHDNPSLEEDLLKPSKQHQLAVKEMSSPELASQVVMVQRRVSVLMMIAEDWSVVLCVEAEDCSSDKDEDEGRHFIPSDGLTTL